ncbi:uncharacterized protein [Gossypium hirsutum]|uniref:Gag-Pol polyprotein n=1 Tax=Gossypium hirsutum TaxID=3635 RepID=A0A1U8JPA5_GOSHI|nr:uncharacterized protein LOC107907725 [Gossypium hirsutum]
MCKRFEDGLNEDIKLLVGILELKEFVVLVDRVYKAKELSKEKSQAETEARDSSSARNTRPKCNNCNKLHLGECRMKNGACFRCGSFDYYLRDYSEKSEKDNIQTLRPSNIVVRGRPPRNLDNVSGSHGVTKDYTITSEAQTPARAYVICVREDASAPNVITGTFSLIGTDVTALIDPESTHSYVCTKLVSSKNLPVESTEFVVKVLNHLSQYVLV